MALPAPALAQGPTPSAHELREDYPLHASPEPTEGPAQPAVATRAPPRRTTSESGSGAGLAAAALLAVAAFAAGFALRVGPLRRRAQPSPARPAPPEPATGGPAPQTTPGEPPLRVDPGPAEPATTGAWTAEVEWLPAAGDSRFRVVGRPADRTVRAVIAESDRVEWPPSGPAAVAALTAVAEGLEARLVAAGWRPLARGDAWYAKRFAWDARSSGRFGRTAWPEGTEDLWRCEVELEPSGVDARFRAIARRTDDREPRTVGVAGDVQALAAALVARGWERAGTGSVWYAERFVWRREDAPPTAASGTRRGLVGTAPSAPGADSGPGRSGTEDT